MELWDRVGKGCLLQAIPHGMVSSRTLLGGAVAGTLEEFPRGSPECHPGGPPESSFWFRKTAATLRLEGVRSYTIASY